MTDHSHTTSETRTAHDHAVPGAHTALDHAHTALDPRGATLTGRAGFTRKRFVDWLLGTTLGGLVLAVLYPVARYIVPPPTGESTASSVTLALKPAELKPNSGEIFKFGNKPGIIIRTPGGDLRAFTAVCTHLGCIVQYSSQQSEIWCPCHNGHYDLNGRNISGPPPRPLTPYVVNVHGGKIVVSRKA